MKRLIVGIALFFLASVHASLRVDADMLLDPLGNPAGSMYAPAKKATLMCGDRNTWRQFNQWLYVYERTQDPDLITLMQGWLDSNKCAYMYPIVRAKVEEVVLMDNDKPFLIRVTIYLEGELAMEGVSHVDAWIRVSNST